MYKKITLILTLCMVALGIYFFQSEHKQKEKIPTYQKKMFGGVYKSSISASPSTMDPALCTDTTSSAIISQIFSRLLRLSNHLKIVPDLVSHYEISADKKTYTFYLRQKVRFHTITENALLSANQGREVGASDVKFSFERVMNPKTNSPHQKLLSMVEGADEFYQGTANHVSGIDVIDPWTLKISLKYPYSPFPYVLSTHALSIVPKEDVEKWGNEFTNHPVGSGAFIFEGIIPEKMLILRSNLDFHRGRPYLDKVEFNFVRRDFMQYQLFEKGQIYHLDRIPNSYLKDALKKKKYKFQERSSMEISYMGMNVTSAPFDNVNVRRALNHAVNKTMIVRHILQNRGIVARGVLPPGIGGYNPLLPAYDYDLDRARAYLREAGHHFDTKGMVTDFPVLELQINESETTGAIAEVVQANLADLGIQLKIKVSPWRTHLEKIDIGEVSLFSLGWVADYPDADNILYYNFHSASIATKYNSSHYANPHLDELLFKARESGNEDERIRFYKEAEKIISMDAPWIFLHHPTTYVLLQPWVHGIELSAFGASEIDYYYVWISREEIP